MNSECSWRLYRGSDLEVKMDSTPFQPLAEISITTKKPRLRGFTSQWLPGPTCCANFFKIRRMVSFRQILEEGLRREERISSCR
jgi:hypothetical protein